MSSSPESERDKAIGLCAEFAKAWEDLKPYIPVPHGRDARVAYLSLELCQSQALHPDKWEEAIARGLQERKGASCQADLHAMCKLHRASRALAATSTQMYQDTPRLEMNAIADRILGLPTTTTGEPDGHQS